jgi:lipopolysaccharide/colanic/teichoic acid biosynthesis glycosyltransferase
MKTASPPCPTQTRSTTRTALQQRLPNLGSALRTIRPTVIPVRPEYALKVIFDYVLASILFVLAIPVILGTLLLVKLTSHGPALYSQTRVGRAGRSFTIYKVRTMNHNCEKFTGPQWSGQNDVRINPVGKVLRKLHLDELPQLWNVLRGEMSLIGPRPERPEIVEDLRLSVFGYDVRHQVKPGISGFAQIHLPPDSNILTVHNKLIYDRYYISRMGLWFDFTILIGTAMKVVGLQRLYQRLPRNRAGC